MTPASQGRIDEFLRQLAEDVHQLHAIADATTLCGFASLGRRIRLCAENVSRIRGQLEEEVVAIASAQYEPASFMLDFLRGFPGIPTCEVTFGVSEGQWCITVKIADDPRILQATGDSLDEAISKIVAMK